MPTIFTCLHQFQLLTRSPFFTYVATIPLCSSKEMVGECINPDLVLFTGDFGNENVDLVRSISNLEFTKAIILGNHDAWNTQKFSARYSAYKSCDWQECFVCLSGATREKDAVQLQLESLGDEHVGYRRLDFPDLKLSVVGGRPFSCGGEHVYRKKLLTASMFPKSTHGNLFNIPEILLPSTTRQSKIF